MSVGLKIGVVKTRSGTGLKAQRYKVDLSEVRWISGDGRRETEDSSAGVRSMGRWYRDSWTTAMDGG